MRKKDEGKKEFHFSAHEGARAITVRQLNDGVKGGNLKNSFPAHEKHENAHQNDEDARCPEPHSPVLG